jgi:tRNA_anti-like
LPTDTMVVGRPPTWVGWVCIFVAAFIALLSTANYLRLEFQPPIKRRTPTKIPNWTLPQVPARIAPSIAHPGPTPPAVLASPERSREDYSDATIDALVEMAKTPNLTAIQIGSLLAPYKGKWMDVQGVVTDVEKPVGVGEVRVDLSNVNGDDHFTATAWFVTGQERAAALHRGANVHVLGKIRSVYGFGLISFDECELTD